MVPDDEALVARARGGDDDAFRLIFERHHRGVYRFIYALTGDHARTEDVVQDTFVAAYRGMAAFRGGASLRTWLCAVARNTMAKSFRRGSPPAVMPAAEPTPEAALLGRELDGAIARALRQLDEEKRVVFTLKTMEGLSYDQIAAITGSSIAKLKTDLFRAKAHMRKLLAHFQEGRE
jgi:RNA polymerase sigma-70 factor (ECF subfamily)